MREKRRKKYEASEVSCRGAMELLSEVGFTGEHEGIFVNTSIKNVIHLIPIKNLRFKSKASA